MKLSVVILNYNVRYFLELCLQSVQAALKDIPSEVIVVDNNSMDESCVMVKKLYPNVILIENTNNIGFSKANNQALKVAKGELVCILNPDTVVAEDTFHKILDFISKKTDLGVVGCKMINGSGHFLPESKRRIPTVKIAFQKIIGYTKPYYASDISENTTSEVDVLTGAFMLMHRSLYNELNGFDEDFFMYGEDIDLCYRALKLGYKNYYFSDTTIIHFKGESTLKDKTYFKWFFGAMQLFHYKHFNQNIFCSLSIRLFTKLMPIVLPKLQFKNSTFLGSREMTILKPHSKKTWLSRLKVNSVEEIQKLSNTKKTDLIFDSSSQSFKTIINHFSSSNKPQISFKIWPKDTTYCVGSDVSKQRGEVIHFDQFEYRSYF